MTLRDISWPADEEISFRRCGGENDVGDVIVVGAQGEVLLIAIGKLDMIIVAGVQVGVAGIVGIFIPVDQEGVELLVAGAVDPSAIAQHEHMTAGAVQLVIDKGGGEEAGVVPGE